MLGVGGCYSGGVLAHDGIVVGEALEVLHEFLLQHLQNNDASQHTSHVKHHNPTHGMPHHLRHDHRTVPASKPSFNPQNPLQRKGRGTYSCSMSDLDNDAPLPKPAGRRGEGGVSL